MRTFTFNFATFTATFATQVFNGVLAQGLEPAPITVLAPDSSFLFENADDGSFVYTDVTPKGVAINGQTTYAALAVGTAEYVTTVPLFNKGVLATTTFTWSVGIVADASQAEYVIFETGGAQLLDLQCTYSDSASGACSEVQQGEGNFIGAFTGRRLITTFTPVLTVSAPTTPTPTPTPSANITALPQGSASESENTTQSTVVTNSTFTQMTQTNALPSSSPSTSTTATTKSSGALTQNFAGYWWIISLSIALIWF